MFSVTSPKAKDAAFNPASTLMTEIKDRHELHVIIQSNSS